MSRSDYARRNLLHAKAVGVVANTEVVLQRLGKQKRAPAWLVDAMLSILERAKPVAAEMAKRRDEVIWGRASHGGDAMSVCTCVMSSGELIQCDECSGRSDAYADGAAAERARIVAWLRTTEAGGVMPYATQRHMLAGAIERGKHNE